MKIVFLKNYLPYVNKLAKKYSILNIKSIQKMENKFDDDFLEKETENNLDKNKYLKKGIILKRKI